MGWKSSSGKLLYRVNDIVISASSENPSKYYGGTWELLCPGKTLVCIDANDTDFSSIKKTGGSKFMQNHNHIGTTNNNGVHSHGGTTLAAGGHRHTSSAVGWNVGANNWKTTGYTGAVTNWGYDISTDYVDNHIHNLSLDNGGLHSHSFVTESAGNGNAQNLQPFMVVYMWIRTK